MSRANGHSTTPPSPPHVPESRDPDALAEELHSQVNQINREAIETLDAIQDPDKDMLKKRLNEEIAAYDTLGAAVISCQRREGIQTRRLVSNLINDTYATRKMTEELLRRDDDRRRREKEREEESVLMMRVLIVLGIVGAFVAGLMWPVG